MWYTCDVQPRVWFLQIVHSATGYQPNNAFLFSNSKSGNADAIWNNVFNTYFKTYGNRIIRKYYWPYLSVGHVELLVHHTIPLGLHMFFLRMIVMLSSLVFAPDKGRSIKGRLYFVYPDCDVASSSTDRGVLLLHDDRHRTGSSKRHGRNPKRGECPWRLDVVAKGFAKCVSFDTR